MTRPIDHVMRVPEHLMEKKSEEREVEWKARFDARGELERRKADWKIKFDARDAVREPREATCKATWGCVRRDEISVRIK